MLKNKYSSNTVQYFSEYCGQKQVNPQPKKGGRDETGLQYYLHNNLENLLPNCTELLLCEKPIVGNLSHLGVADLIYLQDDGRINVVETKYLDLDRFGHPMSKSQKAKRGKVRKQVVDRCKKLSKYFGISPENIVGTIATNDPCFRNLKLSNEFQIDIVRIDF